ncbi:MAG: hypothetical protein IPK97_17035 [Ahniella sp.]|nr:hypothetical protein [Ahniella sp.]
MNRVEAWPLSSVQRLMRVALVFCLASACWVHAGGFPSGSSTMPLLAARGTTLACNQGDWVHCPIAEGGLATNRFHAYFVEIPAGTSSLTLQIFDADVGAGAGEAAAGRDTGVATAAQSVLFSLRNPAGTVQTIRFNEGNGVAAIGGTTTGIALTGTAVNCATSGGTTTADNNWCTVFTVNTPTAGHWELRAQTVSGTPIHYLGVRALDNVGGRDLNVYARSFLHYGNQSVDAGRTYNGTNAFYPYVTEGCQFRAADFDSDDEGTQFMRFRSRTGTFDQTLTEAAGGISGNDNWNDELYTFTSLQAATQYGIWLNEVSSGIGTSNHVTPWFGSELSTGSPPTAQPQGGADRGTPVVAGESYRIYFPNNAGGAPLKPFLEQRLSYVSGASPPVGGSDSIYRVTLSVVNPTPYPIDFANATGDIVRSYVPNGGGGRNYRYVGTSFLTNCGAVVSQPANNADDAPVTWNPGTIPANTSCTAEYRLRLTPAAGDVAGTVIPLAPGGATNGTRAQFLDETDTRFIFGPLCALQLTVGTTVPVPVTLSYFLARPVGQGTLDLTWRTDSEAGTIGFHVYSGDHEDALTRINPQMIAAKGGNTLDPTDYQVRLGGHDGKPLWIEEVSDGGRTQRYGPYLIGESMGSLNNRVLVDWLPARQALDRARTESWRGAADDEVALRVGTDGAQRIRHEDLAALGVDWTGSDALSIGLYLDGTPLDITIDGGPVWGPGSAVRFLGNRRTDSLYTHDRIYRLRRGDGDARRMSRTRISQLPPVLMDRAPRSVTHAPDTAWSFAAPTADPWYAFALTRVGAQRPSQSLVLDLPDRAPDPDAMLRASLWGGLNHEDGPDHRVLIDINGQAIVDDRFDGIGARLVDQALPESAWQEGSNTVTFTLDDSGFETDRVHVESVSIAYRAYLRARDDRLEHGGSGADQPPGDVLFADGIGDAVVECAGSSDCLGFRATRFQNDAVKAYRIRGSQVQELEIDGEWTGEGFEVRYGGDHRPGDRYVLATLDAHRIPAVEAARPVVDLFAGAAQYLAIGPAALLETLEPLLAAHRADGLSARAVAIEDLYAQFGDGSRDPMAVKRFVQAAYQELGTRYLLLAGGDTYDYFNHTGTNSVSLVPTFYRHTHPLIRYGATDMPYGDIDEDGRLDLAVGRLPARDVAELQRLVTKTLQVRNNTTSLPALMVADKPADDTDFGAVSDQFEALADAGYRASRPAPARVFLDAGTNIPAARDQLFAAINAGRQWVSYYGHGSPIGWTQSGLLGTADVGNGLFTNEGNPIVATMWGCWGGFFVDPNYQGLSHALLGVSNAGAAVVIAASGLTESNHDERFANLLVPAMTAPGARIGDAFRQAQRQLVTESPEARDVTVGMQLLGDPALRLQP